MIEIRVTSTPAHHPQPTSFLLHTQPTSWHKPIAASCGRNSGSWQSRPSKRFRRFDMEMREAERDPHDGKRKVEALWPIHKIHYQKSRCARRPTHMAGFRPSLVNWIVLGFDHSCRVGTCMRCTTRRNSSIRRLFPTHQSHPFTKASRC